MSPSLFVLMISLYKPLNLLTSASSAQVVCPSDISPPHVNILSSYKEPCMNNQYNYQADDRIRQQQAKVQEVVGIMKDNVNLVLERETRLAEIDTRADELQVQSKQFQAVAGRVRRKYFWQNMKMWFVMGGLAVVIVVVIIVWSVSNKHS
ncbi:unnamed protein product [Schistosoma rodhaini]|nr:unnamed protein product [Schistosoma rodhaini]